MSAGGLGMESLRMAGVGRMGLGEMGLVGEPGFSPLSADIFGLSPYDITAQGEIACPMGAAGQALPATLAQLQRFAEESLPLAAVAHSYHVDALANPQIAEEPSLQQLSLVELNELHHQIALLGALLRLQAGDPTALQSVGRNLAGFLENRQLGLQIAATLPIRVRQEPAMQEALRLTEESTRQVAQNWPLLVQMVRLTGAASPGPLLVGRP